MRIIHTTDYFQPQLGYQDRFLAQAQLDDGHDVAVVTSDRYRPFQHYDQTVGPLLGPRQCSPGLHIEEGIPVHRLPVLFEFAFRCWVKHLERTLLDLRPDIVYVHGVSNFFAWRVARLKAKLPHGSRYWLIIDDHMTHPSHLRLSRRLFYWAFQTVSSPLLLSQADALVAVSEDTKSFMVSNYGFPQERVSVVPLGVYTKLFSFDEQSRHRLRQQYNLPEDGVLVVYAGKLVPKKGPDVLIKAALELMAQDKHVFVLLIGDGPGEYVQDMKSLVQKSGFDNHFIWQSSVLNSSLPGYYSAADIGVWPRASSLTMIEAQACRLPIVVSDFPAAAERVRHGNGLVYRELDVTDLTAKLGKLVDSSCLRRSMGSRGYKVVQETLDYRILSEMLLDLAMNQRANGSLDP